MMYITTVTVIVLGMGIISAIYTTMKYKKELGSIKDIAKERSLAIDALSQIKELAIKNQKMKTINSNGESAVTPVELYNSFNLIVQIIELPTIKNLLNSQEDKFENGNKNDKNCD